MRISSSLAFAVAIGAMLVVGAPMSNAYETWSQGKVTNPDGEQEAFGNCKTCHAGFRDPEYKSLSDGRIWSEVYQQVGEDLPELELGLHDIHRHIIVDKISRSRCDVCHSREAVGGFYPVLLDSSETTDLEPISCVGCHGRYEDDLAQGFPAPGGLGAGLRQHHTNAGVKECMTCHADANPERYVPVGEHVQPPNYFTPDAEFPNKPTDACNPHGEEDYAGTRLGLDNDGDHLYDKRDPDCRPTGRGRNNGKR